VQNQSSRETEAIIVTLELIFSYNERRACLFILGRSSKADRKKCLINIQKVNMRLKNYLINYG